MPHVPGLPRIDGRQRRWEDHNAERRQHVLQAAVELLEEQPPGAELHVQQIAERAGLVRTVVYRLFNNRADLNRAVQRHVVAGILERLEATFVLTGTPEQAIHTIISAYVDWVAAHPQLHDFAARELGDGEPNELERAIDVVRGQVSELLQLGARLAVGEEMTDEQRAATDLLVTGLIGQVRGTVNQWVRSSERPIDQKTLARLLSRWSWFQIEGESRELGLDIDATTSLDALAGPTEP